MNKIKRLLSKITSKEKVFITKRGNDSIKQSLRYCKEHGYHRLFIQDQGGWMTYPQYAERLKLNFDFADTDYGIVEGRFSSCILLINTMPGYAYLQDVSKVSVENSIVINDVSGSIGHKQCQWGDIIIGSFGVRKPVNYGQFGFIATDLDMKTDEATMTQREEEELLKKLLGLKKRIEQLGKITHRIKNDLKDYDIVHPKLEGINVIIKCDEKKRQEIIEYCDKQGYEFTLCPRYIRINEPGISIEVKRL